MMASFGPSSLRILASTMVERTNSGLPERPPASPAWAVSLQSGARKRGVGDDHAIDGLVQHLGRDILELGFRQVGRDLEKERRLCVAVVGHGVARGNNPQQELGQALRAPACCAGPACWATKC